MAEKMPSTKGEVCPRIALVKPFAKPLKLYKNWRTTAMKNLLLLPQKQRFTELTVILF